MEKQLNLFDECDHPGFLIHSEVFPDAESEELEYKLAQGGFPKDFWTTYRLNVDFSKNVDTSNVDTSKNVDTSNVDTSKNVDTSSEKLVSNSSLGQRIRAICMDEYTSVEDIAIQAERSVKYLKNKIIPRLLKEGTLVKMYPQRNHPQQKYITKGKSS